VNAHVFGKQTGKYQLLHHSDTTRLHELLKYTKHHCRKNHIIKRYPKNALEFEFSEIPPEPNFYPKTKRKKARNTNCL